MPRLLLQGHWYERLPHYATTDDQYERLLKDASTAIFPEFKIVTVRQRVAGEDGDVVPHLALYDSLYRSWWLAVLETGPPPTSQRLKRDANILRSNHYDQDFISVLAARDSGLDRDRFSELVRTEVPKVLFVVAHPPAPALEDDNIRVGIVEIFQNSDGQQILRVNGEKPEVGETRLATCVRDLFLTPRLLQLKYGAGNFKSGLYDIEFNSATGKWMVMEDDGQLWLLPPTEAAFPAGVALFELTQTASGRMRLTPTGLQ